MSTMSLRTSATIYILADHVDRSPGLNPTPPINSTRVDHDLVNLAPAHHGLGKAIGAGVGIWIDVLRKLEVGR